MKTFQKNTALFQSEDSRVAGSDLGKTNIQRTTRKGGRVLLGLVAATLLMPVSVYAQDTALSRFLLIEMSREQNAVLCGSAVFTQCMAFTEEQCLALSEKAVEKCLMPLPERIEPETLQNASIEACPRDVYADAGYTDEKAQKCLAEALPQ